MGGKKQTTTQNVTIPPEVMARYNAVNARAESTASKPFQQYGTTAADFVAQINPQQTSGINAVNAAAGSYRPLTEAGASATQAGMGPAYAGIDNYMSPYIKNVADTTGAMMRQQQEQAQSGALGTAVSSGAFGGDRAGIAAANLQQQNQMGYGKTMADIMNQGYTQALGASQADLSRQMQGGAQLAGIGAQTQQLGLQGAEAQLQAGGLQQQTEQAGKTALINQFMQEQGYPFQVAQFLANIAMGTGALSGSTTTTQQPASFFASGGSVRESQGGGVSRADAGMGFADGGGVAGPYGSPVGSQPWMEGYIPQAYLPVGELMMSDPSLAQQSSQGNTDYINQMIQMGQSIKGLTEGKAYGGGVEAPNTPRSYLSDVIEGQKQEDRPELMRANSPDGQKSGGLGETLGNVVKIMGMFKDGGVVGRGGYADGGGSTAYPDQSIVDRIGGFFGGLAGRENKLATEAIDRFNDLPKRDGYSNPISETAGDLGGYLGSRLRGLIGNTPAPAAPAVPQNRPDEGGMGVVRSGLAPAVPQNRPDEGGMGVVRSGLAPAETIRPQARPTFAPETSIRPQNRTTGDAAALAADTRQALGAVSTGVAPPVVNAPPTVSPYAETLPSSVTGDAEFMTGVRALAQKHGVSEGDILKWINAESGFNPSASNQSGATGLIQFMPKTAAGLGTSTSEISQMSRSEQLPLIDQYLTGTNLSKVENPTFNDLYVAGLWPAAVGKPDNTVLFSSGSKEYEGNAPLDLNADGDITKGEAGQWAMNKGVAGASGAQQPGGGLSGANMAAAPTPAGGKAYADRNTLGQAMYDPKTNKLSQDALLSILSGVGTMASSPSRFLGSALLQGIGGAAGTLASLRQQAPERASKQLENMRQVAMDTMQWNEMNGTNLTPSQYAAANGINIQIPETATASDILTSVPSVGGSNADDKLGYQAFQSGSVNIGGRTVPMQNDPASIQKFIADNSIFAPETPIGRAVERAKSQLDTINATGGITVDSSGNQFQIPGYTSAGDVQAQATANREASAAFRAAAPEEINSTSRQMAAIKTLEGVYEKMEPGKFANIGAEASAVLSALDPNNVMGWQAYNLTDPAQYEIAMKGAGEIMAARLATLPGGAPKAEIDFLSSVTPTPNMQPDAIKKLLAITKAEAKYRMDMYNKYDPAIHGNDVTAYVKNFADEGNTFSKYVDEAIASMPRFAGEAMDAASAETELAKRGYVKNADGTWSKP